MRACLILLALLLTAAPVSGQVSGPWAKVVFGSDTGPFDSSGTGSPENVVLACPGSTFRQTDATAGNVFWVKDGATGCDTTGWIVLAGGGGGGSHNIMSATHSDASPASVTRGSLIVGNSTPAWSRLNLGAAGTFLRSDGTDAGWSTNGAALTSLNASELSSGTVPDARLSANVSLLGSAIASSEITDGTIVFADWASNSCSSNQIPKWNGAAWACAADEAGGGGGSHTILSATHTDTDPDTLVEGDLLVANSSDLLERLPVGSEGDVLTISSGVPAWEAPTGGAGAWSLRFTALANLPPASNPATFNTRNATPVLEFDTTTQEVAVFLSVLPNDYGSGGVTVCTHWAAATATSGTIGWDVAFERIGDSQQDLDSDGFGSATTITATTVPGTSGHVDIVCANVSDGANMDSLAAGESFRLRVRRDVSNDDAAGDAQLVAVDIREQ